jgi:ribonuclease E
MAGKLLIDAHYSDETRIAIVGEDGKLSNFEVEQCDRKPIKGNIYLAKIVRVEPAIQAAFIDYGDDKHGFLPLSEIHYDYFNKNVRKAVEDGENNEEISDGEVEKPRKRAFKIQEVISQKQIILVQAEKEVRGNKCAFFSTFISIPGRYCILMPNPIKGKSNSISKKIDSVEKERLREIIESLNVPNGMSCIVRTAGENKTKQEIKRDFEYLCRLWDKIRDKVTSSIAPTLIYEEGNIIKRSIRDLYQGTMEKIIIQGKNAHKEAKAFMKSFTPSHVKKIELYDSVSVPIFHKYGVEDKVNKILEPVVSLPSGGSIVINTTEALTAIDVNSGRLKNERNIEGTALKTNLEATIEIARQIKLRDLAGIIVIDFIDMEERVSNIKVEKRFREVMKIDHSNTQIGRLSQFGLMELSRQRLRTSFVESNFVRCKHCDGLGKILSDDASALLVIRKVESFLVDKKAKSVLVETAAGIDLFILNHKKKLISEVEETYSVKIEIVGNSIINRADCKIVVKEYKTGEHVASTQRSTNNIESAEETSCIISSSNAKKLINKTNIKPQKNVGNSHKNENTNNAGRLHEKGFVAQNLHVKRDPVVNLIPQKKEEADNGNDKNTTADEISDKSQNNGITTQSLEKRKKSRYHKNDSKQKEVSHFKESHPNAVNTMSAVHTKNIERVEMKKVSEHTENGVITSRSNVNAQNRRAKKDGWLKKIFGN